MSNPVRDVFDAAHRIATSAALHTRIKVDIERQASNRAIESLLSAFEILTPQDLGISSTYFSAGVVTHVSVFRSAGCELQVYCLPALTSFPLHFVPLSFGVSVLLSGKLFLRSLDSRGFLPSGALSADVSLEDEVSAPSSSLHTETVGALREMRAVEDSVVADLFFGWKWDQWHFFEENQRRNESVVLQERQDTHVSFREKGYRGSSLR